MELNKVKRETFVMHAEYIEDLPEEAKAQFLMYIYDYGIKGIIPELTGFEKTAWIKIQRRIDADIGTYEKKCSNLKQNRRKSSDTENTTSETEKTASDTENTTSETENELSGSVNEFDIEFVNDTENEIENLNLPNKESPSATAYAQKLFNILQAAHLPCARDNFISFLQRDFKNAMAYIHSKPELKSIRPEEIIQATENYAATVNDSRSFIKGRYSLERFVTFKNFVDFLPGNYNPENFIDSRKEPASGKEKKQAWKITCPHCKAKEMVWDNQKQRYRCEACGREYTYEEAESEQH